MFLSNTPVYATAGTCTTARVKRSLIGSLTPGREYVTATCEPGVPRSFSETLSISQPCVGTPSIAMMRSPSCTPASSAGVGTPALRDDAFPFLHARLFRRRMRKNSADADIRSRLLLEQHARA